jgi:hypothetical protein
MCRALESWVVLVLRSAWAWLRRIYLAGLWAGLWELFRRSGCRWQHILLELPHHVAGRGVAAGVHLAAGAPATPQGGAAAPDDLSEVACGFTEPPVAIAVLGNLQVQKGAREERAGRSRSGTRQVATSGTGSMLAGGQQPTALGQLFIPASSLADTFLQAASVGQRPAMPPVTQHEVWS